MPSSVLSGTTYEVTCGACGGRLRVAAPGQPVGCPHCGEALAVPADVAALAKRPALLPLGDEPEEGASIFDESGVSLPAVRSSPALPVAVAAAGDPNVEDAGSGDGPDTSIEHAASPSPQPAAGGLDFSAWGGPAAASDGPASDGSAVFVAAPPSRTEDDDQPAAPVVTTPATATPSPAKPPAARRAAEPDGRYVPRTLFTTAVIYGSVATAVCLALLYLLATRRTSQLESLPDVVPRQDPRTGQIIRGTWPADAPLPPGHTLALGETGRFGDLLVTPLKVTREPLEFAHRLGGSEKRPSPGEVLKLWLKFENAGDRGRSFAPLDADLLFFRQVRGGGRSYQVDANNFLASAGDRANDKLVFVYDHVATGDWDLAGEGLGQPLSPGESETTYVPSETDPPPLSGPLVWRLQLRKGVASNGWGVTTLVEIAFDAARIEKS